MSNTKEDISNLEIKTEATTTTDTSSDVKTEEKDPLLDTFYNEIDDIKPEDLKTNSKEQLDRLLRPGSTYFNLNPFEVLQIDPYASLDEIKKKYRKLSIYVHPDKNPNERDRAQIAFEAVNRAYKMLDDDKERKKCLEVVDEARDRVNQMCEEKRKKTKKELAQKQAAAQQADKKSKNHPPAVVQDSDVKIEEDDPDKYRYAVYVQTCKLFADIERLKVRESEKKAEERKRKADEKAEDEGKNKVKKEWDKNYEESREGRVSSWKNFVNKKGPTTTTTVAAKPKPTGFFRPPKHKPESR